MNKNTLIKVLKALSYLATALAGWLSNAFV